MDFYAVKVETGVWCVKQFVALLTIVTNSEFQSAERTLNIPADGQYAFCVSW